MARKRDRIAALILALVFFVTSVGVGLLVLWQSFNEKDGNNTSQEEQKVLAGTKLDNFTPVEEVTEVQTTDIKDGDGPEVKPNSTLTVDYTGALASTGVIFESSFDRGQPASFSLDMVIPGWKEGLTGMKQGGTRRVIIPARLAYGANPPAGSGIPKNANLVFDVIVYQVTDGDTTQGQ